MIDLHTHLLPGIDDGATSLEEAVQMIRQGKEIGITAICTTPHLSTRLTQDRVERIMESFLNLREKTSEKKIGVDLRLGSEIDLRIDFDSVKRLPFFFINLTPKYLFVELPLGEFPSFSEKILFSLLIEGYSPILVHPERSLQKEEDFGRIEKLKDSGIAIQLNAGSLLGDFGKKSQKTARKLLQEDLVDLISSDAHDLNKRPITVMAEAFKIVNSDLGEEKTLLLFEKNPEKILRSDNIETKVEIKSFLTKECER
ncbi:MAG TPA: CpsB/CapC family capsule biosynthesis tyrosine phosphatase [Terriglobales bacterium]|nr:CpsB/CapC family capsule biosynthesis tyrosine phosphatase [Terriglobales bacterium]